MAPRTIDGPGRGANVTTEVAARYLGVSVTTFRRLVGLEQSDITLPGVRDWIRPVRVGKGIRWNWLSIVYLAHVMAHGQAAAPGDAGQ